MGVCQVNQANLKDGPAQFDRVGSVGTIYPCFFEEKTGLKVYCDCEEGPRNAWTVRIASQTLVFSANFLKKNKLEIREVQSGANVFHGTTLEI